MASYGNRDDNVYVNWVKASAGSVSPEKTVPLEQHFDVVMCCDWSCDREVLLAFGGRDGLVSLWKVENKALQASRLRLLLTATATPQITLEHLFTGFKAGIECVSIDASNRLLFTADTTASFYIHSVETGECLFVVALKPILTPILRGSFKHLHVIAMACSVRGDCFVLTRCKKDSKVVHVFLLFHCNGVLVSSCVVEEEELLPRLLVCRDGDHFLYCHKAGIVVRSVLDGMKVGVCEGNDRIGCAIHRVPAPVPVLLCRHVQGRASHHRWVGGRKCDCLWTALRCGRVMCFLQTSALNYSYSTLGFSSG